MSEIAISGAIPEWTLADRLRKSREHAGLHQQQLADEIGVSRRSIGKYEDGITTPRRPVLIAWALRCGVNWEWLTTGTAADKGAPEPPTSTNTGTTAAKAATTRRYLQVS